tara:strand:+ start:148479 stop:150965 length:2487 start_codon:yes stop_codon:yes gene_type:complete
MIRTLFALLFSFAFLTSAFAQQPLKPTSSQIYESIKKLNFLGSALYIAAHPDDENTRLISHLSNHIKARTAYLSVTRGDGGQNLIGPELRDLLGVIRTYELLEARKTDGGEQYFTRAVDFGYSKSPDETFSFWGNKEVLSDVVLAIRKFRPDVIINRFNHRTPGTTHGHHTASAILGLEAFELSGDASAFPEQLKITTPWQPKRIFFNTSWWFYGSQENFEKADKSNLVALQTGKYYPSLGLSNGEIAALSRSKHQSQGFGNTGVRGEDTEYLEILKGDMPKDESDLFEGINTGWSRIEGGEAIGEILYKVQQNFDFSNPAASVPELVKAYTLLKNRTDYWGVQKTKEIKNIIAACSGLFLEAVTDSQSATRQTNVNIELEAINRSDVPMQLVDVRFQNQNLFQNTQPLESNTRFNHKNEILIPKDTPFTSAYWLKNEGTVGLQNVRELEYIGMPRLEETFPVTFKIALFGETISFTRNLVYKYNSPVTGEVYQPFQVIPEVTGHFSDDVFLFPDAQPKTITVRLEAERENLSGMLSINHPDGWSVSAPQAFQMVSKGEVKTFTFTVTPPSTQNEGNLSLLMQVGDSFYTNKKTTIDYSHIPFQHVLLPAKAKVARINIEKRGDNIGYIMGAGDAVPLGLRQIGYRVTEINPETITKENLTAFDAVVVGIRAYNTIESLKFKQQLLFDYVAQGGNVILQYNVSRGLVTDSLAPYDLDLSRDRVTDEESPITFLAKDHPALNTPNKISQNDFDSWVQERGLYFPDSWAKEFTPVLRMNDPGENPVDGALLIAKHGKGHFVYTGLSFFRQLPAGVLGAFRLFANLLSLEN